MLIFFRTLFGLRYNSLWYYASGEAEPESDVDLLVIHDSTKSNLDLQVEISLALDHSFPLDIVVRKREEIETRSADNDFFIKNFFERGIVLYEQTG